MIRVQVVPDLVAEGWVSMDLFAQHLIAELLQIDDIDVHTAQFTPKLVSNPRLLRTWSLFFNRDVLYGRSARGFRGINHIIDHSYGGLLAWLDPRRTVVTVHDLYPLVHQNAFGLSSRLFQRAANLLPSAAMLIAVSNHTRESLIHHLHVKPEHVVVVPQGLDPAFHPFTREERAAAARQLGKSDSPLVLHVGSCQPRKNVAVLLAAMTAMPDVTLWQVGGRFSAADLAFIESNGLTYRVKQWAKQDDILPFFAAADCFVFPSLYEGFGMPPLEALASGLPVVSSNATSLPETLGDAALYVDPHDADGLAAAIQSVLNDPVRASALREKGVRQAARFSWARTAEGTARVYRQLAESRV